MDHAKRAGNLFWSWLMLLVSERRERSTKTILQAAVSISLVLFVFVWFEIGLYLLLAEKLPGYTAAFLVFFIDAAALVLANFAIVKWKKATPSREVEAERMKRLARIELTDATDAIVNEKIVFPIRHYYARYRKPVLIGTAIVVGLVLVQIVAPTFSPKSR